MSNILTHLSKGSLEVLNTLIKNNYQAYIVGGAVRDALMNHHVHDYDITTNALPDVVEKIFLKNDYKVIETGLKHGTITVIKNNVSYEITTYRIDGLYQDNRHPEEVEFTNDLQEDLKRRDFTINALACDMYGNIIDYNGGISDIRNKLIRTVGNPIERFNEDGLRIIRAIRFSSVLDFEIENNTKTAILEMKELVKNISIERKNSEMEKMLSKNFKKIYLDFHEVLEIAYDYNIVLDKDMINKIDLFPYTLMKAAYFLSYLDEKSFISHIDKYRFSNDIKQDLKMYYYNNDIKFKDKQFSDYDLKKYLSVFGIEKGYFLIQYICYYNNIDILYIKSRIEGLLDSICDIKTLNINGDDLIKLNYTGSAIGRILTGLVDAVLLGKVKNEKTTLIKYIKKIYKD